MNKSKELNNHICTNCEKSGHLFHQCKLPIISYGIIAVRKNTYNYEYLMICRKDSFGYIDFIRGKYSLYNLDRIKQCIDGMSISEKDRILTTSFEECWQMLWGNNTINQYKNEEASSQKKFLIIKNGLCINNRSYTLDDLIKESTTNWTEPEWEFPKGRRNFHEKDIVCAMREFEEETGIRSETLTLVNNALPSEEVFIASNHRAYKHKYYLAMLDSDNIDISSFQRSEVSQLEWKTLDNCIHSIRECNLEKKHIVQNINKVLEEYRLYS